MPGAEARGGGSQGASANGLRRPSRRPLEPLALPVPAPALVCCRSPICPQQRSRPLQQNATRWAPVRTSPSSACVSAQQCSWLSSTMESAVEPACEDSTFCGRQAGGEGGRRGRKTSGSSEVLASGSWPWGPQGAAGCRSMPARRPACTRALILPARLPSRPAPAPWPARPPAPTALRAQMQGERGEGDCGKHAGPLLSCHACARCTCSRAPAKAQRQATCPPLPTQTCRHVGPPHRHLHRAGRIVEHVPRGAAQLQHAGAVLAHVARQHRRRHILQLAVGAEPEGRHAAAGQVADERGWWAWGMHSSRGRLENVMPTRCPASGGAYPASSTPAPAAGAQGCRSAAKSATSASGSAACRRRRRCPGCRCWRALLLGSPAPMPAGPGLLHEGCCLGSTRAQEQQCGGRPGRSSVVGGERSAASCACMMASWGCCCTM